VALRDGLMERHEMFDDRIDALACTAEFIGGARGAVAGSVSKYLRAYRDRDWATMEGLWAPEAVIEDHRPAGLGRVEGREGVLRAIRGLVDLTPDVRADAEEFLELADSAALYRHRVSGHESHGGSIELSMLIAAVVQGSRILRAELFPVEDGASARRRFAELSRPG
jgi:hypothetical protein